MIPSFFGPYIYTGLTSLLERHAQSEHRQFYRAIVECEFGVANFFFRPFVIDFFGSWNISEFVVESNAYDPYRTPQS